MTRSGSWLAGCFVLRHINLDGSFNAGEVVPARVLSMG